VDALKQKYGLSTVPFTGRPVTEIFEMATIRHPPFKPGKEDVGFRDAVIFLSVVDDLVAVKGQGHRGALVTRDGAFHDPRIIEFAARAGVELQVFRSVTAVYDSFLEALASYAKVKWDESAAQARHSLESRLPEIQKFISENLEISEWGFLSNARVVAVPRIEVAAVGDVRIPDPLAPLRDRIRLSFDVRTKFDARVERFPLLPTPRRLKIGQEEQTGLGDVSLGLAAPFRASLSDLINEPTEKTELVRVVRVEASADPKFETFSFESVSITGEVITPGTGFCSSSARSGER